MKIVAPCKSLKAKDINSKGKRFLTVISFSPHSLYRDAMNHPSSLYKEEPTPAREEEGNQKLADIRSFSLWSGERIKMPSRQRSTS